MTRTIGKRSGFTLVEILVVLGIVAFLSALLLTVFSHVREAGRNAVCQSNLRQIALAVQQYSADNAGFYPLNTYSPASVAPSDDPNGIHGWIKRVQPYLKNREILKCPDFQSNPGTLAQGEYSDYQYNSNLAGISESQFTHPANTKLAADYDVVRGDSGWLFQPSSRHSGHSNYVFADGHVKWLKTGQVSRGHQNLCASPEIYPFTDCYR